MMLNDKQLLQEMVLNLVEQNIFSKEDLEARTYFKNSFWLYEFLPYKFEVLDNTKKSSLNKEGE